MDEDSSNNANSDRTEKPLGPADVLRFFGKEERKTTVILLYAALALTLWKYIPSLPFPSGTAAGVGQIEMTSYTRAVGRGAELLTAVKPIPLSLFLVGELKCFAALVLMGLIPMAIVKWGFREKLADYGLRLGNRYTIRSILIFTPLMLALGYWGTGANYAFVYPFNPLAVRAPASLFRLHLLIYAATYYVGWEFMFRGFLLKGLEPKFGLFAAILVQALAATLLHIGHPLGETLGCLGGSIFWGCLAHRTQSLLPGWVQHAALGLALDAAIFARLTGAF